MRKEEYIKKIKTECRTVAFWRDVFGEFVGTFILVSVQCALPLSWNQPNLGTAVQTGVGMGFVICSIGWALGDFGGAHLNPAVSFAMSICTKITAIRAILYMCAQCVGGIAGAGFVYAMVPSKWRGNLAATTLQADVMPWQGFFIETWLTFILTMTIFGATNEKRKNGNLFMPTLPIGFALALGIMSGFGSTGGSLNPARSLGPAVMMGIWKDHWVYWCGPLAGGAIATLVYVGLLDRVSTREEHEISTTTVHPLT